MPNLISKIFMVVTALAFAAAMSTLPANAQAGGAVTMRAADRVPNLQSLLQSAERHHPRILAAKADVQASRANARAAFGAFDFNLNQEAYSRLSGFYDGQYLDTKLSRRLDDSNITLFSGYRYSTGNFPIYEDYFFTGQAGEVRAGVAASLLQDREIDRDRANIQRSRLEVASGEVAAIETTLLIQLEATQAYIAWSAAQQKLAIFQDLLTIAEQRAAALERRVNQGDAAAIDLTENRQILLQRRSLATEVAGEIDVTAANLALYWRDSKGNQTLPALPPAPPALPTGFMLRIKNLPVLIDQALSVSPALGQLGYESDQVQLDRRLAENAVKPRLDLEVTTARDLNPDINSLVGTELTASLNFSLPLERTAARSARQRARSELNGLEFRRQFLEDRIRSEILQLVAAYGAGEQQLAFAGEEIAAAAELAQAERARFQSGAGDFFLVNIRERNLANAQLTQLDIQQKMALLTARLAALTADFTLLLNPG